MIVSSLIVGWMKTFQFPHAVVWGVFLEVDDGFWEGELDGRTGVFPSLVVEIIHVEGEEPDQEVPLHRLVRALRRLPLVFYSSLKCFITEDAEPVQATEAGPM